MSERVFIDGLVSVIMPVYNAEKSLDKSLKSVFDQTYKDIEIVIVDDCSTDNSRNIIENYQKEHHSIKYYRQSKNGGAGVARNKALELSSGQYVAFLDADDTWHPSKIEKQVKLLKEKDGAFSYTAIQMVDEQGNIIKTKREVKETIDYRFLLHNTMIATSTVLIDRKKVGDFRMSERRGGQDYATWLKLLRDGTIAYGINEALENYTIGNKNSLSSNKWKSIRQVWEIQTKDEKINYSSASINLLCFIFNAAKKYLL